MTHEEIDRIARVAVERTLLAFGFDLKNPREVQADFQTLREIRLLMRSARRAAILAVIGVVVPGLLTLMWFGIQLLTRKG